MPWSWLFQSTIGGVGVGVGGGGGASTSLWDRVLIKVDDHVFEDLVYLSSPPSAAVAVFFHGFTNLIKPALDSNVSHNPFPPTEASGRQTKSKTKVGKYHSTLDFTQISVICALGLQFFF